MVEVFREVRRVLRDDGTLWLNLGDSYASKNLVGIPWRTALALQADGWWLRSDIIWSKPNPMPESITDRPTKAHEYLFLLTKSARYYYDAEAITEQRTLPRGRVIEVAASRNRRSVWMIAPQPFKGAHFATFPEKLVEPCVLAGSRDGDRVLDPFAGSGTTVVVAERLGRVGIGVECKSEYLHLARARMQGSAGLTR
jgi:DNA modification methylase